MSVLRRGYVPVEPDVSGFDAKLREKFQRSDPGGKAGRQLGGQLNRALKRVDLDPVDIKGDPKKALAAIAATEAKLQALSRNASTVEIKVRAEQALKEIGRFRKTLGDVGDDPEPARNFVAKFSARLGPLLAQMPIGGPMSTALVGAGVAAAPLLGAAVAGGIIGGAGAGGVVGGLTLAAKDTRVKAAADELGDRLERRLYRAGGAFVGPAIQGLGQVERALAEVNLESIFADSAKFVDPLAAGISSLIVDLGGAFQELIANADGPVRAIADGIAQIGRAASTGLKSLSDNGKEGASALRTVFGLISSGIQTTFNLVNVLTELYGIGQKFGADMALQGALKLTGAQMDANTFSAQRTRAATLDLGGAQIQAEKSAEQLKEEQEQLKNVQTALTSAQDALSRSLDTLGGKNTTAARGADALRTAMDNLYGATQRQDAANQSYEASWDALSASVKANKRSLDIHTESGRANRDTLKTLITSTNEAYMADINAGVAIDKARTKHENRIKAIKEESRRLGLNEDATKDLIGTYGKIPGKKQTDLILGKVGTIVKQLENLYIVQRALAEGIPLASARAAVKEKGGPAKQFGGYATGGLFDGRLPGPPSKVDNLRGHGPDGRSFGLAGGEFIEPAHAVNYYGLDVMEAMRHRRLPREMFDGYATGGYFPPVDRSTHLPMRTSVANTHVMTLAQAKAAVTPNIPAGGGAMGPWIERAAKALVPGIRVISGYRPGARTLSGNVSLHASNDARDFGPSKELARKWDATYGSKTTEFISPYQQYNRLRGQRHSYTGAVWNQHNFAGGNPHDHIGVRRHKAMDDGGFRMLQPGMNLIPNGTGKKELIGGPAAMATLGGGDVHIHLHNSVIASERQAVELVAKAYKTAVYEKKIPDPGRRR